MKRVIAVVCCLVLVLVVGCQYVGFTPDNPVVAVVSGENVVGIVLRDKAISKDADITITNIHDGSRAEVIYRIHNATGKAITPMIYPEISADVANFEKAQQEGYVKPPILVFDWIELPVMEDVNPGEVKDFIVALQMPKKFDKLPEKWAYQIGVAINVGSNVQIGVGIWHLITMR